VLLVKGLLHTDDAQRAQALGCDGTVVSSHGGRALKVASLSLTALQTIARRLDGRIPILFDSGIRTGHDVVVALACGASAVHPDQARRQ
jgi:isopentenyl diphosphate isomerase/L-lactate dehydrogenase-like FMN-dependent dehydrogenase